MPSPSHRRRAGRTPFPTTGPRGVSFPVRAALDAGAGWLRGGRWHVGRSKKRDRIDTEVRAALAEFAATVEVRVQAELERSRQAQLALIESIRGLQQEMHQRDGDLARALREVGRAIDHSTQAIEADRVERRALADALGQAVRAIPPPAPPAESADPTVIPLLPRERLVGGRVESTLPPTIETVDVDLV